MRNKKENKKLTIEEVESISGVKLTYPNQKVTGSIDDEKYKELKGFGCSDIWDDCGSWLHRDCFSSNCKKCNYYPIVEQYNKENGIKEGAETDLVKAGVIFNLLSKLKK